MVDYKNRHGPSLLTRPRLYASVVRTAVDRGLGSAVFFLRTRTVCEPVDRVRALLPSTTGVIGCGQ